MIQEGRFRGLQGMSNFETGLQNAPSDYQRKLSSVGGTLNTGMQIAGAAGQMIYPWLNG